MEVRRRRIEAERDLSVSEIVLEIFRCYFLGGEDEVDGGSYFRIEVGGYFWVLG